MFIVTETFKYLLAYIITMNTHIENNKITHITIKEGNDLHGQFFCNSCGGVFFGENLRVLTIGDQKNYLCKECWKKLKEEIK